MEIMLMAFHLIFSFAYLEQMGHFGPENDASHNSGSNLKDFFLKSCIMEGTKRYMKIILMVHQKNIVFFYLLQ